MIRSMKHEKGPGLQALACGVVIAVVATACSGINASKSVSPLDFILPGIMQNSPPQPVGPLQTNNVPLLAHFEP